MAILGPAAGVLRFHADAEGPGPLPRRLGPHGFLLVAPTVY